MLTTRQRYLAAITDHWGGLDVGSFPQRLLLQKRVFFLNVLGVSLGYSYSWYIRGPYSTALTRDAFGIVSARSGGSIARADLPDTIVEGLQRIREIFGEEWDKPVRMELLASVYDLSRTFRTIDVAILSEKLTRLKGHFSPTDATEAVEWLTDRGLFHA